MTYEKSYEKDIKKSKNAAKSQVSAKKREASRTNEKTRALIRDHALESNNTKVVAAVKESEVRTIKARKTMPFPKSVVLVSVICTVLFMFIMLTMAQINEFTQDISALKSELSELQAQEEELKLNVELKNDLRVIEDVAINQLGMVKADEVLKQYVVIGNEDKIEVVEPETTENGLVNTVMSAIGENFRELVEYIN